MSLAEVVSSRAAGLPIALLAGLIVSLVIMRLGRGRFSPRLFGVALAVGALAAIPPIRIEGLFAPLENALPPFEAAVLKAFCVAGLIEEAAKLALAYYLIRPHYLARTSRDIVLGVATVALGFALIENIGYVTDAEGQRLSTALLRAAMSVPGHVFTGLVLGLGVARTEKRSGFDRFWRLMAGALIPAALLHGLFDLPVFLSAHAPPYSVQVIDLANRFSMAAPTLVESFLTLAIAFECIAAAFVIRAINRMPFADDRKYRVPSVSPSWLSDLLYSPATGWRAGGLLLIGSVATFSLALDAVHAGALTSSALNIARYCLCPATLGWALLSRPSDAGAGATSYVSALKREWLLTAAASLAAVMLVVTSNPPRDALLAATLRDSGFARALKGDVDGGIDDFTTALAYEPDDKGALLLRSEALIEKHEYEQALADTDRLLAADPKDLGALVTRGKIHRIRHDYAAAETDFDGALIAKPEDARLLSQRAEARQHLGKRSEASSDLERAARADPSAIEPHLLRIEFALNDLDLDAASREIDAASHLNPSAFAFLRGRVQFHRGDFAGAVSTLRVERNVNVLYPALWQFLAASRSGQDGARELAARSAKASRTQWPFPLAQVFLGEKTLDEARSLARDSDETCEVDYYGSEWRLARGERNAALEGLRRAAAQCPVNFVEYSAARIELRELGAGKSGT